MAMIQITKTNFDEEVLHSEIPVLLDFYADWCGPCRALAPTLIEIAAERDDVKIGKINIDAEKSLAEKFKVRSIPTLILMEKEDPVAYVMGARSKQQIMDMIDRKEPEGVLTRLKNLFHK